MKYFIKDNYISEENCKKLVEDASRILKKENFMNVLNSRLLISSTSLNFLNLIEKSINWKNLHNMINSQLFLNFILENLNISEADFKVTNYFYQKKINKFLLKYKNLNQKKIALINTSSLLKYVIYRITRELTRIIKFKFAKKRYVELIYDYSISPNGYKREIHRDSDARTFVFLLYLNNLSAKGEGGDLEIYKYNLNDSKVPSRPDFKDCELIKKVTPKPGRLVVFLNSHDSLHAVSEMKNHEGNRHFLYGSFTLLAKKNKFLKNSMGPLPTDYNLFD